MTHGYCLAGKFFPNGVCEESKSTVTAVLWELELLKNEGYHFAEIDVGTLLSFSKADITALKSAAIPIKVCNCFIPGKLEICNPGQRVELLAHAKQALESARRLGIELMVFGSGTARRIPAGMSIEDGLEQISCFLGVCNELAAENNIIIVVEPLNHNESNILLTIRESADFVRKLGLSYIKLLADTFHMSIENEDANAIVENLDIIEHIHIAEDITRGYPGSGNGILLGECAAALKKLNYTKRVTVECGTKDWEHEIALSKKILNDLF